MAANKHAVEDLITLDSEKNFLFTEAFKTLRTNLSFCMSTVYYISLMYSISILIIKLNSIGKFFFQPQKQYWQHQQRKHR